jgi:hypothetical protein
MTVTMVKARTAAITQGTDFTIRRREDPASVAGSTSLGCDSSGSAVGSPVIANTTTKKGQKINAELDEG